MHHGLERWHRQYTEWIDGADLRREDWRTGRYSHAGMRLHYRAGEEVAWVWARPYRLPRSSSFDPLAPDPGRWIPANERRSLNLAPLRLAPGRWEVTRYDTWGNAAPRVRTLTITGSDASYPIPETDRDCALRLRWLGPAD